MFKKLLKKKEKTKPDNNVLVAALLVHAAKIDENYTNLEKIIIKKALIDLKNISEDQAEEVMLNAEKKEEEQNQIIEFTKEVKKMPEVDKIKIIEALWQIIYSNKNADIYEINLMRRLAGLLYIDNRIMGDIKERVKKEFL